METTVDNHRATGEQGFLEKIEVNLKAFLIIWNSDRWRHSCEGNIVK